MTGDIVRNTGASNQAGYVSLRVLFTPFNRRAYIQALLLPLYDRFEQLGYLFTGYC